MSLSIALCVRGEGKYQCQTLGISQTGLKKKFEIETKLVSIVELSLPHADSTSKYII